MKIIKYTTIVSHSRFIDALKALKPTEISCQLYSLQSLKFNIVVLVCCGAFMGFAMATIRHSKTVIAKQVTLYVDQYSMEKTGHWSVGNLSVFHKQIMTVFTSVGMTSIIVVTVDPFWFIYTFIFPHIHIH